MDRYAFFDHRGTMRIPMSNVGFTPPTKKVIGRVFGDSVGRSCSRFACEIRKAEHGPLCRVPARVSLRIRNRPASPLHSPRCPESVVELTLNLAVFGIERAGLTWSLVSSLCEIAFLADADISPTMQAISFSFRPDTEREWILVARHIGRSGSVSISRCNLKIRQVPLLGEKS